jgi:RHS repeat-associated protein
MKSCKLLAALSDLYADNALLNTATRASARWVALTLLLGSLVCAFAGNALHAQTLPPTTADDQMGLQPYQSYHGGDIDHISLSNGTLSFDYPFLSYSQRGSLSLSFSMLYNNQPQHLGQLCTPEPPPNAPKCLWLWGFTPVASALPLEKGDVFVGWAQQEAFYSADSTVKVGSTANYHYSNWSVQAADGSKHPLGNLGSQTYINASPDFYSVASGPFESLDATGWRANGSLTTDDYGTTAPTAGQIVDSNGMVGGTLDPNGNLISTILNSSGTIIAFNDTVGRQIPAPPIASSASNTDTTTCPVSPLLVDHAVLWSVSAPNGGTSNYKFCYAVITINIPPGSSSAYPYQGLSNKVVLQSIVLPDLHSWNFQYNDPGDGSTYNGTPVNYGTLTQITLPTGGTVSYTYVTTESGRITCQNDGRWVASRTVNANDGTGSHMWTYSYSTSTTSTSTTVTTTVTDPLSNYAVHTFNSLYAQDYCPAYEAKVQYFQSGGTLLNTVNTNYSFTSGGNSNGPMNVVPTQVTTVWPNGKTATVTKSYDSGFTYTDFKGATGVTGIYGTQLSESASDYGNNAAGATLRTTNTSYLAFSNSNYLNANLLNLVSSKTVVNSNSCKLAEIDTTYDESTYLTSYTDTLPPGSHPGPPNPAPVRGNPTAVTQQLFAAGTCPTTTQSGPTSHTNWYDTGEVYQAIDPLGNTTTHNYNSSYGGAYPTKSTNPLGQSVTGTYDFNTGLLTTFTDANTNPTTFAFDSMRRVTSIVFAKDNSGNQPETTFAYSAASAGFPVTVQRSKSVTTSLSDSVTTSLDGLGRTSQTQHATPNGNATVVTTYDGNGRVASVTNPYFATTDPTYGVTSPQYDGIGRVTKTTKQDGSTVTAQFNQSSSTSTNADCTIGTDEAGNQRQTCVDGIGRLVEVDEPGNSFGGSAASGSLGLGSIRQNVQSFPATYSTGQFTVNGTEQQVQICTGGRCRNAWDTGSIKVTVGGFVSSTNASQFASAASIASALAGHLSGSQVNASLSSTTSTSATYTLTALNPGPQTIPVSYGGTSVSFFAGGSSTVTGGQNGSTITTYDSGTVTASVNGGFTVTVCYGQSSNSFCSGQPVNSTTDQVGAALAQALSAQGSPVKATYGGGTLSIAYSVPGVAGNVSVTVSSNPDNPSMFPGGSFSGSTTLEGGADPYSSGLKHPYVTLYSYDGLGNLLCAEQHGDAASGTGCSSPQSSDATSPWRVRRFIYDSLLRLVTAKNPESGAISYSYDADGNLLQKTSPQANQTGSATTIISFCYDALNRVTGRGYSAQSCPLGTPAVTYTYDGGTNGAGHLTSLADPAGSGSYSYDALGRIISESRTIAGNTMKMGYSYYLDGSINTLTYPSGAAITYTPWSSGSIAVAGAAQSAADNGNGINYIGAGNYQADGQITSFTSGASGTSSGILNTFNYNPRFQPCRMTASSAGVAPGSCIDTVTGNVLDLGYNFNYGSANNGNVYGITNFKDTTRNQTFTYDALNRLISAQNAGTNCAATTINGKTEYWGNSYGYDAWGNLLQKTVTKCSAENMSVAVLANNQLTGYSYDAAGNMTSDPTDSVTSTYDPENRIAAATKSGVTTTYTYDDDGNRVEKTSGGTGTLYWYMSPGIVAESDLAGNLQSEYVFFSGERVARKDFPGLAVSYYFSDHLKTASVITDAAGKIKSESDYYPWGGELQFTNNDSNHYKFTGKERDSETGLDYFGARYYSNGLASFITPDWAAAPEAVPYADLTDPQSLNQYSYVRNIPTVKADQDGHCPWCPAVEEALEEVSETPAGQQLMQEGAQAAAAAGAGAAAGWASTSGFAQKAWNAFTDALGASGGCCLTDLRHPMSDKNQAQLKAESASSDKPNVPRQNSGTTQNGNLPKPPRGKGSVPKNQRDPKRTATDKDKAKMRADQNGNCAQCDQPLGDEKGIGHHTPDRHADGGSEMKLVHETCHNELHSCN